MQEAMGLNRAVYEFCMRHSDDPKAAEGLPKRPEEDYVFLRNALASIKTDGERMENCLAVIRSDVDVESKMIALEEIQYLVENLDNALDFLKKSKGHEDIKKLLTHEDVQLREMGADIIGTIAQNNPMCQHILVEDGVLDILLEQLPKETECRMKMVFGISAIVRNSKAGVEAFHHKDVARAIANVLEHTTDKRTCKKALFFLTAMWKEGAGSGPIPQDPATLDRIKELLEKFPEPDVQELVAHYLVIVVATGGKEGVAERGLLKLLEDNKEGYEESYNQLASVLQ